jgi:hypothetical protein
LIIDNKWEGAMGRFKYSVPDKTSVFASAVALMMLVSCGGGSSVNPSPEVPLPAVPTPPLPEPIASVKLEVFTGKTTVDFSQCRSDDGAVTAATYSQLQRATVYQDAMYLAESGEGCTNVTYDAPGFVPNNLRPAIRKVSGGVVQTAVRLNDYFTAMSHPTMVRYPSSVHRKPGSETLFVLGYAAASSEHGFVLDDSEAARYTAQGGWSYNVPGLFKFAEALAGYDDLVAGTAGQAPRLADGQGHNAGFYAPHDLEVDAAGQFYLIDQNRIRTIDANHNVATLESIALGITGTVKALDADRLGRIHALVQRGGPSYSWYRLADGRRVDFRIRDFVTTEPMTFETIAVVGDDLVLGVRAVSADKSTQLFRVAANGMVTGLSGATHPTTPQDFLDNLANYLLPQVQHIEYGLDGHLYIVLPQGVLRARGFK